ncbi:MAG: hypothetical protein HY673_23425 [Chloroflexi bacterium]|nr:hypothetical protein [Chloroflexota bacterium]
MTKHTGRKPKATCSPRLSVAHLWSAAVAANQSGTIEDFWKFIDEAESFYGKLPATRDEIRGWLYSGKAQRLAEENRWKSSDGILGGRSSGEIPIRETALISPGAESRAADLLTNLARSMGWQKGEHGGYSHPKLGLYVTQDATKLFSGPDRIYI